MVRLQLGALAGALLTLVACGDLDEEDFREEYTEIACQKAFECDAEEMQAFGIENEAECEAFLSAFWGDTSECDYDEDAAKDCIEAIEEFECEDESSEAPSACADVYSGSPECEEQLG